jgi:hypothetical protein
MLVCSAKAAPLVFVSIYSNKLDHTCRIKSLSIIHCGCSMTD